MRMIFSTVFGPQEPAFTVGSLAITQTGRPPIAAIPVTTPSAPKPSFSQFASSASSANVPWSTSLSIRSRTGSLPCWADFSRWRSGPPARARSSAVWRSLTTVRRILGLPRLGDLCGWEQMNRPTPRARGDSTERSVHKAYLGGKPNAPVPLRCALCRSRSGVPCRRDQCLRGAVRQRHDDRQVQVLGHERPEARRPRRARRRKLAGHDRRRLRERGLDLARRGEAVEGAERAARRGLRRAELPPEGARD